MMQISDKSDHQYFGRPEHATNSRPIYLANSSSPGADLAAEYAAGFAAAASLFASEGHTGYAEKLFRHAKQAFAFAQAYRSK
jgi:endoglucanase